MKPIALITGASSGFGAAIAEKLADQYALLLVARRFERLEALQARLQERTDVHIAALDVSDRAAVEAFLPGLPAPWQAIEVLVNNAGLALGLESADKTSADEWQTMVDTNISGLMHMTRQVLPGMVERNNGHIINMGSIAGSWPYPGGNVYGATKAFVQQFSRGIRSDVLGHNIRVSNIEPGLAETEFSKVRMNGDEAKADAVYTDTDPLQAEDIAEIAHWMLNRPAHVNINAVEVMPVCQAWSPLAVNREMKTQS